MRHMPGLHALPTIDEQQLLPEVAALLQRLRQHIEAKDLELDRKSREIAWRDALFRLTPADVDSLVTVEES